MHHTFGKGYVWNGINVLDTGVVSHVLAGDRTRNSRQKCSGQSWTSRGCTLHMLQDIAEHQVHQVRGDKRLLALVQQAHKSKYKMHNLRRSGGILPPVLDFSASDSATVALHWVKPDSVSCRAACTLCGAV